MNCNCKICQQNKYPYTTLEDWRKSSCFGGTGYEFWQWDHDSLRTRGKAACSSIVRQSGNSHGCPADTLGRDNIASAILDAEQLYRDNLGFPVVPEWHQKVVDGFKWGCTQSWRNSGKLVLPMGKVLAVGTEKYKEITTVAKNTAAYQIKSVHGKLPDTFELGLSGIYDDIDPDDIQVYINKSERTSQGDSIRKWRIPTNSVTLDRGVLTITGNSYLLAKPELYEAYAPFKAGVSFYADYSLNPEHMDNYVDRLDIVVRYVDSCEGSKAISKRRECGCPTCKPDGSNCRNCENVSFCIDGDGSSGIVEPVWNYGGGCHALPKYFCVNYQAGDCSRNWTGDIVKLSIAQLCGGICGCAYGCMSYWWQDLASEDAKSNIPFEQLSNPIGTRRGHIHAASVIKKNQSLSFSF